MNIFLLSCSWHERTIYRASGVKLVLCCQGKGRRDLSAEHSITVGYGGPARGQARELWRYHLLYSRRILQYKHTYNWIDMLYNMRYTQIIYIYIYIYIYITRKEGTTVSSKCYSLGGGGRKPLAWPTFLSIFDNSRKNNGLVHSVTFSPRIYHSYNHAHAPGPHMWPSPGPGPNSNLSSSAPKQSREWTSDVHVKS